MLYEVITSSRITQVMGFSEDILTTIDAFVPDFNYNFEGTGVSIFNTDRFCHFCSFSFV